MAKAAPNVLFGATGLEVVDGYGLDTLERGVLSALAGMSDDVQSEKAPLSVGAKRSCRATLMGCVKATMPKYEENWHHTVLANALDKVRRREITRLLVLMPPRHGKTQLVSRHFPAYLLGKNPDEQVIGCSYSAKLASQINRDVQRIMMSEAYQYAFPNTQLNSSSVVSTSRGETLRNSNIFEIVDHDGYYISAGIGGSITGRGFTIGIVDDPIKNRQEADSIAFRNRIWEWWTSTFLTRGEGAMSPGGTDAIVVTLTPWHEDDLSARIQQHAKDSGEEWTIIRFPAVLDEEASANDPRKQNEALWPRKFDRPKLAAIQLAVGTRDWDGLYQCRPSSKAGTLFKLAWWRYYHVEQMRHKFQTWTITVDAAFKDLESSSYVVIQVWGKIQANHYLVHQVRAKLSFLNTCTALKQVCEEYPLAYRKLVEDKANGPAIINALKNVISGLCPRTPKGSKESRAQSIVAHVESGNVHLPYNAPWLKAFEGELTGFPTTKHDDQVDAMVQYLLEYQDDPLAFLAALSDM